MSDERTTSRTPRSKTRLALVAGSLLVVSAACVVGLGKFLQWGGAIVS